MAIGAVGSGRRIDGASTAAYRRFSADAPRDERAGLNSNFVIRPTGPRAERSAASSPAELLGALIGRMGGAIDSRAKGSYVNLRV